MVTPSATVGGVQDGINPPLCAITVVINGAPAEPAAVIVAVADGVPAPFTFTATTWKSYVFPPASPLAL